VAASPGTVLTLSSQRDSNARGAGSITGLLPSVFSRPASFRPLHPPVVAGPEQCTFQMVMHEVRANSAFAEVEPEDYLAIF